MAGPTTAQDRRLLYFADPMCSWCWGFAPVITALVGVAQKAAPLRLVMGGLRPGARRPMSEAAKAEIRHHWEEVHRTTGQPFNFDFFERDGFVYDTEPASRAVIVMHGHARARVLDYLEAVQHAFYVDNRDVTQVETLAELAVPFDVDEDDFASDFTSEGAFKTTAANFKLAKTLGISGFPTVILRNDQGYTCLTAGYQPLEALQPLIEEWLAR